MLQSIIHSSDGDNFYHYNDEYRLSMLIHPEFKKVIEAVEFEDVDSYYIGKYAYLKEYGLFSSKSVLNIETNVSEAKVKECISHIPQVLFEVTDFCNLNCTYCALGDMYEWGENRNSKNLDIDSAISLLKYIWEFKLYEKERDLVISFYGGEPLLNIKFIKKIVEYVDILNCEKRINIGYSMTTNAMLLDKYIDYLVTNNFNILISLDGNEKNNSYRVTRKNNQNSFQKVISNLDLVKEKYPSFFDSNIKFNAVLHDRNSVKTIYEFIYKRYSKIPQVSEMNKMGVANGRSDVFRKLFHNMQNSQMEYCKEKDNLLLHEDLFPFHELANFLKYFSVNSYVSDVMSTLYTENKYFPASTCLPFSKKIFLTTRGLLMPCERINYKYFLGRVDGNVVIDTLKIAQQYSAYYEHLKDNCQHCYLYRFCGLCMFNLENFDELGSDSFSCDYFHNQKDFQSKLYRIFSFLEKYPNDFFKVLEDIIIVS